MSAVQPAGQLLLPNQGLLQQQHKSIQEVPMPPGRHQQHQLPHPQLQRGQAQQAHQQQQLLLQDGPWRVHRLLLLLVLLHLLLHHQVHHQGQVLLGRQSSASRLSHLLRRNQLMLQGQSRGQQWLRAQQLNLRVQLLLAAKERHLQQLLQQLLLLLSQWQARRLLHLWLPLQQAQGLPASQRRPLREGKLRPVLAVECYPMPGRSNKGCGAFGVRHSSAAVQWILAHRDSHQWSVRCFPEECECGQECKRASAA